MHLSISNFNPKQDKLKPPTEIVALLLLFTSLLMLIECTTRIFILPKSSIERRTELEYNAASAIRRNNQQHTLLLLGNSLLGDGILMHSLGSKLPSSWKLQRLLIEDTAYYDWYYGMQRLFLSGSHPDTVILMLSIRQFTSIGVRGEYFARHLLNLHDIPDISRNLQLHPTTTAGLVVGNLSSFYGTRVEIRKQILGLLIPDLSSFTRLIIPTRSTPMDETHFRDDLQLRFHNLKQLADSHSIRIAVLIAPESNLKNAMLDIALDAAFNAKLDALAPFKPNQYSRNDFSDGFHLNATGAAKFTNALAETLQCYLSEANPSYSSTSVLSCNQVLSHKTIRDHPTSDFMRD
jgi:hypothetical protein